MLSNKEGMKPVRSTTIAGYSYNAQDKVLRVQFKSGSVYVYKGINPDVMSNVFDRSASVGSSFISKISKRFKGTKEQ